MSDLDEALRRTLDDGRLSRGERTALGDLIDEIDLPQLAHLRSRVFAIARAELERRPAAEVLAWAEAVTQLIAARSEARLEARREFRQEAWFSPDDACPRRIVEAIDAARETVDVCVFTLTDDRISAALAAASRRGVAVRLITDDEKSADPGSDVERLRGSGVAVRMDRTPFHMHHKFALFDRRTLLTGSYNWTRSADRDNHENFVVSEDPVLLRRFARQFDALWAAFGA
jgi:phosphatidylserine/phosphatidylglycerophosphate/cardiolipin synthase-like enzyme